MKVVIKESLCSCADVCLSSFSTQTAWGETFQRLTSGSSSVSLMGALGGQAVTQEAERVDRWFDPRFLQSACQSALDQDTER